MSDKTISDFNQGEFLIFNKSPEPETNGGYSIGGEGAVYDRLYTTDHYVTDVNSSTTVPRDNSNTLAEYVTYNPNNNRLYFRTVTGFTAGAISTQALGYLTFT